MQAPVLTRWRTITEGVKTLIAYFDLYKQIAPQICKATRANEAQHKIAKSIVELLSEPLNLSDALFLKGLVPCSTV